MNGEFPPHPTPEQMLRSLSRIRSELVILNRNLRNAGLPHRNIDGAAAHLDWAHLRLSEALQETEVSK